MGKKKRRPAVTLEQARAWIRARFDRAGFAALTDRQKMFYGIEDMYWSSDDFCLHHSASSFWLAEHVPEDEEPTDEDYQQAMATDREQEEKLSWAVAGLTAIGAPKAAAALKKAGQSYDQKDFERFRNKSEDIEALLLAFVQAHPTEFGIA